MARVEGWMAALVWCRVCTHKHASVHPSSLDEDNLLCPNCHQHSGQVLYWVAPDGQEIYRQESSDDHEASY